MTFFEIVYAYSLTLLSNIICMSISQYVFDAAFLLDSEIAKLKNITDTLWTQHSCLGNIISVPKRRLM